MRDHPLTPAEVAAYHAATGMHPAVAVRVSVRLRATQDVAPELAGATEGLYLALQQLLSPDRYAVTLIRAEADQEDDDA